MSDDQWRRIEELFHHAASLAPGLRAEFLARACAGDDGLRGQVEKLLASDKLDDDLVAAAVENAVDQLLEDSPSKTSLAPGTRLGPYEIISSIGLGGMGEVYRARDTKLDRDVAIKVLPDTFAHDPDRLSRFNREAKLLASLNHPNIAHIYGVESQALVMELVEGETLGSLTKSGPLPIETVLKYARQIAEALEAAHEKGIIHRDLKPANIMVTRAGVVKVLDFGLAKAEEPVAASEPAESATHSGVILGTAAYMSPEQARGDSVDKRTDIWAFGVVLYEMLTGRRAFPGETVTDILAAILRGEPDWSVLPRATPLGIGKLLRSCLERERKQRLQAIGEARIEIEAALGEESDSSIVAGLIQKHRKTAIGSVAVVAALLALTWFLMHRPPQPSAELTQKQLTFNSSENPVGSEEISPDGKYLAYSDPTGIHVRLLSTGAERVIPRPSELPTGTYWNVDSWFPDGTQLLADAVEPRGHYSMWTISVVGQNPRHLRDDCKGLGVSPDGTHIAYGQGGAAKNTAPELWVMGVGGENPQKIVAFGADEGLRRGQWSPDGKRLAYIRYRSSGATLGSFRDMGGRFLPEQSSIETCDLQGARRAVVAANDQMTQSLCWLPEGRIVFAKLEAGSNDGNLWQIDINNQTGKPIGKPKRATSWAGSELSGLSATADGKRLVLLKGTLKSQVYVGELEAGPRIKSSRRLTNDEAGSAASAWTADSKAVLFNANRTGTMGVYKQGLTQEAPEPVFTAQDAVLPRLTPDGAWVLFMNSGPSPSYRLMRVPLGGGAPQLVMETRRYCDYRCAITAGGRCVMFELSQDRKQVLIVEFDPQKGRGRVLRTVNMKVPGVLHSGLSADGLTCALIPAGEPEIHISLFSLSGSSDREITVKGWPNARGLEWSSDGKGFYIGSSSSNGCTLLYIDLRGNARVLWKNREGGFSWGTWGIPSPDGRYLAIGERVSNSNVWMVEGF